MSLLISANEAYQTYKDLNLSKKGTKSANFDVIQAILNRYCVAVLSRPCDKVFSKKSSTWDHLSYQMKYIE